jgi:hypothetical protein
MIKKGVSYIWWYQDPRSEKKGKIHCHQYTIAIVGVIIIWHLRAPKFLYVPLGLIFLTYGAETWVLSKQDEHRLSIFERKILRRIYGPVMDRGRWRIRTKQERYQPCGEDDIVKF